MKKIYLFLSAALVALALLSSINNAFAVQDNPIRSSASGELACPPPYDVFMGKIDFTSAQFYWEAGGDEKSWQVSIQLKGGAEERITVDKPEVTLNDLKPNKDYTFKVRAMCSEGEYSDWVQLPFSTPNYDCLAPTDLQAESLTNSGVTLTWKPGSLEETWYIFFKQADVPKWTTSQRVKETRFEISGLTPNTKYDFCVLAGCDNNEKSDSTKIQFTTGLPDSCVSPKNVTARNITKNSVTIGWTHPEGKARDFSVNYKESTEEKWSINLNTATDSLDIKRLKPDTQYDIQVTANCVNGVSSEPSTLFTFSTLVDAIDEYANNTVTLYPNPTTGMLNLDCSNVNASTLDICDVYGRLLNTISISESNVRIDASEYANGLYFIRINTDKGIINKTFIKK